MNTWAKIELHDQNGKPQTFGNLRPIFEKHTKGFIPPSAFSKLTEDLIQCVGGFLHHVGESRSDFDLAQIVSKVLPKESYDKNSPADVAIHSYAMDVLNQFVIVLSEPTSEEIEEHKTRNEIKNLLENLLRAR